MIITFEQIKNSGKSGLDGAILCAFPGAEDVQKEGLIGLTFGTIQVDGKGYDWLLKADFYLFLEA